MNSLDPDHRAELLDRLLPVCDVLVLKALDTAGRWILREERPRTAAWRGRAVCEAHTRWAADDDTISKALRGAWDVLPHVIETWSDPCCVDVETLMNELDCYVHDLCVTGRPHRLPDLEFRLTRAL